MKDGYRRLVMKDHYDMHRCTHLTIIQCLKWYKESALKVRWGSIYFYRGGKKRLHEEGYIWVQPWNMGNLSKQNYEGETFRFSEIFFF